MYYYCASTRAKMNNDTEPKLRCDMVRNGKRKGRILEIERLRVHGDNDEDDKKQLRHHHPQHRLKTVKQLQLIY